MSLTKSQVQEVPTFSRTSRCHCKWNAVSMTLMDGIPIGAITVLGAGSMLPPSPYFAVHQNTDIVLGLNDRVPNLRSIAAVSGYQIHANDGPIGHIEKLSIDDASWGTRCLIIDMENTRPGKHV